jgi:hypothetical protein
MSAPQSGLWVILPDVNVLIYAFRKAPHNVCKPWLDKVVTSEPQFGASTPVDRADGRSRLSNGLP